MDPVAVARRVSFVEEVTTALDEDGDPAFAALDDGEVERRLRVAASEVAAATCRWLLLVGEAVRRGLWADQGARTPAEWLSWLVSCGASTAREQVRVALRLRRFPQVTEAFAAGRLSYSKVRAITRLDRPELEELLLEYADRATGAQLEAIVRRFRGVQAGQADRAADAYDLREVTVDDRGDGTVELRVRLPRPEGLEAAAILERQAVALRTDAHRTTAAAGAAVDVPEPTASLAAFKADAFVAAVRRLAADGPADDSGDDRHLLVLHVDADDLAAPDDGADRQVPVGVGASAEAPARAPTMSVRVLRRLACDARFGLVGHDHDGEVAGVSGTTRRIPARLRRALQARDRTCRFPGCGATRGLDGHHIVHVVDDGPTELANLVLLCRFHHGFVHDRGWTILHDGTGRMRFVPPDQAPRPTVWPLPGASAEAAARAVDPTALQPDWDGLPPDYDLCVAVLQQELARLAPPNLATAA